MTITIHFYSKYLTLTAIPYKSEEMEAAVAVALGTLSVLVSLIWIFSTGIFKQREQTCIILVCRPYNIVEISNK